ncbi:MAG TPA: hypothetical protein VEV16_02450 [Daejeonella sp.]|nr:hypothetical protein [Daejeonella sp.]
MQNKNFSRTRIFTMCIVTILMFLLLLWEHFHGGVPSHHILNRKDLPEISNWWGGLLIPVLTWILLGRVAKRLNEQDSLSQQSKKQNIQILELLLSGLFLGVLIAISFTNNYQLFLDNILYVFLVCSLFFPIYYSEFILGFILGMTYTFGAILPTIFILIIAALGFLIYKFIRPLFLRARKLFG